ncbi:MAG: LLM class flavin-dependent oxidoreductase [Micrococcus sp.]|nr:LLM class flavin-dependent oxidoreductase [Micrococcus sp.]
MSLPVSLVDFAATSPGQSVASALQDSVRLAQAAEAHGFVRVWYAEHHNMPGIASSAPAVLIAHVATQTSAIRLGSGGVMLPNHAPLTVAEQFGMLAELYGPRIDLGVGRAPGTDQRTVQALRRSREAADSFPQDVAELLGYLGEHTRFPGVTAVPGRGTHVPVWVLGSSTFGAQLAAQLGLGYSFASHFAPDMLEHAARLYREAFVPNESGTGPHFIAAVNAIVGQTAEQAHAAREAAARRQVSRFLARDRTLTDAELDVLMDSPAAEQILAMMRYTAVGTAETVHAYLEDFGARVQADELMVSLGDPSLEGKLRTIEALGSARAQSKP